MKYAGNPDQAQDANPPMQGKRLRGNPQGDDYSMPGPTYPDLGNGPRYPINSAGANNTGASNNHGHDPAGNGVGGDSSSPDGHHALVPDQSNDDDTSGAGPTLG